jgi:nitrile hydratase
MGAWRRWNLDAWRYDIECLPPVDYLRMSYYEKWLAALEKRVVTYNFVTHE